jgi:hypothetical protein
MPPKFIPKHTVQYIFLNFVTFNFLIITYLTWLRTQKPAIELSVDVENVLSAVLMAVDLSSMQIVA